jgi:hypothetical protein
VAQHRIRRSIARNKRAGLICGFGGFIGARKVAETQEHCATDQKTTTRICIEIHFVTAPNWKIELHTQMPS